MSRPDPVRPRPAESGFVLIGVVIFVVALTIIGISLFSLSSYEAQFLQHSLDAEQAFQSAVGGIERAKFLLCERSHLDSIRVLLPNSLDVTAASAVQYLPSGDSITTVVDWNSSSSVVCLRVTARVNDQQRSIEARFTPRWVANYYRQLITVGQGITVDTWAEDAPAGERDRDGTVYLAGAIWDSEQGHLVWTHALDVHSQIEIQRSPDVPTPDIENFMTAQPNPANVPYAFPYPPPQDYTVVFTLNRPSGQIGIWETDGDHSTWSLYVGYVSAPNGSSDPRANVTEISVGGFAIWMFPRGVTFEHQVKVLPRTGGQDCLAIIAGDNGIHFNGGIRADIPVILVSSGEVSVRHDNEAWGVSVDSYADELSVFARSTSLMGPVRGSNTMRLQHPASGLLNLTYLPALTAANALPNSGSASGHELALLPGSWRASAP